MGSKESGPIFPKRRETYQPTSCRSIIRIFLCLTVSWTTKVLKKGRWVAICRRRFSREWVDWFRSNVNIQNGFIWVFPKIGVSQNGWFIMENPLKWMIWGYPYFWKHPYIYEDWYIQFHKRSLIWDDGFTRPGLGHIRSLRFKKKCRSWDGNK